MTATTGLTEAEFEAELTARGFERTDTVTGTGRFWRKAGAHLLVPFADQGCYPEWQIPDLRRQIEWINAWFKPRLVPRPPPKGPLEDM